MGPQGEGTAPSSSAATTAGSLPAGTMTMDLTSMTLTSSSLAPGSGKPGRLELPAAMVCPTLADTEMQQQIKSSMSSIDSSI